jgi:hypothetical protein
MSLEEVFEKRPSLVVLLNLKILFLAHHQMTESNLNMMVTMTTMTALMYPLLQDPQARCNGPFTA